MSNPLGILDMRKIRVVETLRLDMRKLRSIASRLAKDPVGLLMCMVQMLTKKERFVLPELVSLSEYRSLIGLEFHI